MFVKLGENDWTTGRWAWFRRLLGAYCFVHFGLLLPWCIELFSNAGMMQSAASPLLGVLANPLHYFDHPILVLGFVLLGCLSGAAMVFNRNPRVAAVLAWYVGACLLARNPLILNPAMPHVGWTLLWFAAIPSPGKSGPWKLPQPLFAAAWLLTGLSLTWSAVTKLSAVSWLDGSALHWVWENPLARDTVLRSWLVDLPPGLIQTLTYGALGLELLVLPAALIPKLRAPIWWGLLCMHLGLLLTVNFADLTTGMLVVHMSLFQWGYLPRQIRNWRPFKATTTEPACS